MENNGKLILQDSEVIPVLKRELIDGTSFAADIFLKMSQNTYILVAKSGNKANIKELHLSDDVQFLYVRKTEYRNVVGQALSIAGVLVDHEAISVEKKAIFISKAAESVFSELLELEINHESIEHAKSVALNIQTLIEIKKDLFSVMSILSALPGGYMKQSISAGIIAVLIAKQMGWTLETNHEKLLLACLLQDVGLKELPKELLTKPRHELNAEERSLFETHPYRGVEILRSISDIPEEICSVVYEHHENAIGSGFPRRLRDLKMNPLAKVVSLANAFCELIVVSNNNSHVKTPAEAIQHLEVTLGQPFNKQAFEALKEIIGLKKSEKQSA